MATRLFNCGFRRLARVSHLGAAGDSRARAPFGASLLELLVVLFIIGVMLGLLFPAIQSARGRVNANVCQNNVRQLGIAVSRYIDAKKRFPAPNQWTVDILKYVEEWDLAESISGGIPKGAKIGRPRLFSCPAQSEIDSSVEGVRVCHYVLVVDRPVPIRNYDQVRWDLHDREDSSQATNFDPWYIGPEISFADQQKLFAAKLGPHAGGAFYTHTGQVRGVD